jgi:hypothetical protein
MARLSEGIRNPKLVYRLISPEKNNKSKDFARLWCKKFNASQNSEKGPFFKGRLHYAPKMGSYSPSTPQYFFQKS